MSDHFVFKGKVNSQETVIFADIAGEHQDACSFWHGGLCDCSPEMQAALERTHDPDCDWLNAYSGCAHCSCPQAGRFRRGWQGLIVHLRRSIFRK